MEKSEKVRSKIIILFILENMPGLTLSELTSIALDTCYMNYFSFAAAMDYLSSNGFIIKSGRKNEDMKDSMENPVQRFDITPKGEKILQKLEHMIPVHIFSYLSDIVKRRKSEIKRENEVFSSFDPDLYGGYTVKLKLTENAKEIISVRLSVPEKELAKTICEEWKNNYQQKYTGILDLMSSRE